MTVVFLKDHVLADGSQRRKGEVVVVSRGVGNWLILAGFAKERIVPGPAEKKAEGNQ